MVLGAEGLRVEFDRQCSTERRHDPLTIMDGANRIVSVRSGDISFVFLFKHLSNSCCLNLYLFSPLQAVSGPIGPVN